MERFQTTLTCPDCYNLHLTCHIHGWKNLAPFTWDDEKKMIGFENPSPLSTGPIAGGANINGGA